MKKSGLYILLILIFAACKKEPIDNLVLGTLSNADPQSTVAIAEILTQKVNTSDPHSPYVHCTFKIYPGLVYDSTKIGGIALFRNGSYWTQQKKDGTEFYDMSVSRGETYMYQVAIINNDNEYSKKSKPYYVVVH